MTGTFYDLGKFDIPGLVPGRRVRAYVPAGGAPDLRRPMLFLFDGQNVFSDEGSFSGGWYAHEAVDKLLPLKIVVAPVVVAIDNGGAARIDELGPWKMGRRGGGLTDNLVNWMADVLMPKVVRRFKTLDGPLGAVVGGSSMGGLAAMYAHYARPDAFGGALCMSPSFWFAGERILNWVKKQKTPQLSRIYFDCGVREGEGGMLVHITHMTEELLRRKYTESQFMLRTDPRGRHNEKAWRRRLPLALRFMFRR